MSETPSQPTADESDPAPRPADRVLKGAAIILTVLALAYTVALTRGFLLPIVLAMLVSVLLQPLVHPLTRIGFPRPLSALLVLVSVIGGLAFGANGLASPASDWMKQIPRAVDRLERLLAPLQPSLEDAQELSKQVDEITTGKKNARNDVVVLDGPTLTETVLTHVQDLFITIAVTVVLVFFLLSRKGNRLHRLVSPLPEPHRTQIRDAIGQARRDVALYIQTISVVNLGLGVATSLAMAAVGIPNPILWGVLASIANFVPYIGSFVVLGLILGASLMTFETWNAVLLAPALFFILTTLEGQVVTPMVLGRRLLIDPVAVFVSILFWSWIWGVPGALLAVPCVTILAILSDHLDLLRFIRPLLK
ncbi:MAG: AI-2E family transporter [Magnetospiraceae bacterium]